MALFRRCVLYCTFNLEKAAEAFEKAIQVHKRYDNDILSCEAEWLWTAYMHSGQQEKAWVIMRTIDSETTIVPVIGDDEIYKRDCLLYNDITSVRDFEKRIDSREGSGKHELYALALYHYYVKSDYANAMAYLDKVLKATKTGKMHRLAEISEEIWTKQKQS